MCKYTLSFMRCILAVLSLMLLLPLRVNFAETQSGAFRYKPLIHGGAH